TRRLSPRTEHRSSLLAGARQLERNRSGWGQGFLIQLLNPATQHGNRTLGQRYLGALSCSNPGANRWRIGVGIRLRARWAPDILPASESHHANLSVEKGLSPRAILKGDLNVACVVPILVHEQNCPVAIGSPHRIGSNQGVTRSVVDGTIHAEQLMHTAATPEGFGLNWRVVIGRTAIEKE